MSRRTRTELSPREVACPTCGAQPGYYCNPKRPSWSHFTRRQAVETFGEDE